MSHRACALTCLHIYFISNVYVHILLDYSMTEVDDLSESSCDGVAAPEFCSGTFNIDI